jgi:hypothetical protein
MMPATLNPAPPNNPKTRPLHGWPKRRLSDRDILSFRDASNQRHRHRRSCPASQKEPAADHGRSRFLGALFRGKRFAGYRFVFGFHDCYHLTSNAELQPRAETLLMVAEGLRY